MTPAPAFEVFFPCVSRGEERGSWVNYKGTQLAQGRDVAKDALKSGPKLYEEIEAAVKAKLGRRKVVSSLKEFQRR